VQPSDLASIRSVSSPTVHPDGRDTVFVVTRPDVEENRYRSSLWRLDLTAPGAGPVRLTHGTRDSSPVYSPDGTRLLFLRATKDGPPQLHVMAADGGDARRLTDHRLGVSSPAWSPDGRQVVHVARVPEQGRYGTDEDVKPDQEAPRLIEHSRYLADGLGYVLDRPAKLFLLDLDTLSAGDDADADALPQTRQLTRGGGEDSSPRFVDGGERVAFVASRSARGTWRPDTLVSDVCSVDLEGRGFRRHTDGTGSVGGLTVRIPFAACW
jgi:Tol biopolymer transport system component